MAFLELFQFLKVRKPEILSTSGKKRFRRHLLNRFINSSPLTNAPAKLSAYKMLSLPLCSHTHRTFMITLHTNPDLSNSVYHKTTHGARNVIEKVHRNSIKITVDLWRRWRDSNSRDACNAYTISSRAPSTN